MRADLRSSILLSSNMRQRLLIQRYPRGAVKGQRRALHDNGVYGYQAPREFTLPDFTPAQLANRARTVLPICARMSC